MNTPEPSYIEQITQRIGKWIKVHNTDEFRAFKRKQFAYTISDDYDRKFFGLDAPSEFIFTEEVQKEHALVMAFLELQLSGYAVSQCQYYFRRFPFKGLPVSRDEHLKHMCELYFAQFYIVKCRIKFVCKTFKEMYPNTAADFGAFIKQYDKVFDQELRMRNTVNHKSSFDDLNIDRIMITRMMMTSREMHGKGWDREHLRSYRASSNEWSKRAKLRSNTVTSFIDAMAKFLLNDAAFLRD